MEIMQTVRFAAAFKRARLKKRWRQEDVANALKVKIRTVTSWEAGERLPSGGMVFVLCMLFTQGDVAPADLLSHNLLIAYLLDDLQRQAETHDEDEFRQLVDRGAALLQPAFEEAQAEQKQESFSLLADSPEGGLPTEYPEASLPLPPQQGEAGGDMLEQLFAVVEQLRRHPELIPVADDFLREVSPSP